MQSLIVVSSLSRTWEYNSKSTFPLFHPVFRTPVLHWIFPPPESKIRGASPGCHKEEDGAIRKVVKFVLTRPDLQELKAQSPFILSPSKSTNLSFSRCDRDWNQVLVHPANPVNGWTQSQCIAVLPRMIQGVFVIYRRAGLGYLKKPTGPMQWQRWDIGIPQVNCFYGRTCSDFDNSTFAPNTDRSHNPW